MTDKEAFEAWMRTPCPDDYECDPKWAEYIWQAAKATGPQWHDKPTAPGLWVSSVWNARHFSRWDVEHFSNRAYSLRWFGPIPEDKP